MVHTIKGFHCKPALPLSHVLKKWIVLNIEIAQAWEKDVPWWYNERAAISIFAGAVWRSGNLAFEEFVEEKRTASQDAKKSIYRGRVDLYLNIDKQDFMAEAKQCGSGASSKNAQSATKISENLSKACSEIRKLRPHGQRRIALVFVVPIIQKSHKEDIDDRIKNWLNKIQQIDCDALAWVFPRYARNTEWRNRLYPGVALLVKEV